MTDTTSFTSPQGVALCLGVFDGVHKGHQALVDKCVKEASRRSLIPMVHSFEPHPAAFFRQQTERYLITLPERRAELLRDLGIADTIFATFDETFSQQTPAQFVDGLIEQFDVRLVITGPDYRFGRDRRGDVSTLRADQRFDVLTLDEVEADGLRYRSSSVRDALSRGDLAQVRQLTGRCFDLSGVVVRGQGRGRSIGFPTANIDLDKRQLLPVDGVYAVQVYGPSFAGDGVMNLGWAPTVRGAGRVHVAEVHVLDFDEDLYGQNLRVALHHRIRPEQQFEGVDLLRNQIQLDIDLARRLLS